MKEITDEQVQAFKAGCRKREAYCLDNGDFTVCSTCSKVLLEIAREVLSNTPTAPSRQPTHATISSTR